jgi:YaiO family outer membrane protein
MKIFAVAVLLFFALRVRAGAADPEPSPTPSISIETGGSSDHLSNGKGDWNSSYITVVRQAAPRRAIYAELSNRLRFRQTDPLYTAGVYVPPSSNTILNIEANLSPTHIVLPSVELIASLEHRLAYGWGYAVGLNDRAYTSLNVRGESLLIDRYWRTMRVAYKFSGVQLSNVTGSAVTHTLLFTRYYGIGQLSQMTLSVNAGRDAENTGSAVLVSDVTGANLNGAHWLGQNWALTWLLATTRQGTLYSRSGFQLGIRRRL